MEIYYSNYSVEEVTIPVLEIKLTRKQHHLEDSFHLCQSFKISPEDARLGERSRQQNCGCGEIVGGERIFWTQVLSTEIFLGRPQKKRNNSELVDAQDFKFRGVEDSLVET